MKEPTKAQIKEFWEGCGFEKCSCGHCDIYVRNKPEAIIKPSIDLNNLFKYAVPKLGHLKHIEFSYSSHYGYRCGIVFYVKGLQDRVQWSKQYDDPALALFWAIWEIK